jgi:hypothetical protein
MGRSGSFAAQRLSGSGGSRAAAHESFVEDISAGTLARAGFQYIWRCQLPASGSGGVGTGGTAPEPATASFGTVENRAEL